MKKTIITLGILVFTLFSTIAQKSKFQDHSLLFLGQNPPGTNPEIFAPGIVSIEDGKEYKPTISPDGTELFFIRRTPNKRNDCIYYAKLENGVLSNPSRATFSYNCFEGQPTFSTDGKRLYYMSCRPLPGTSELCQLPNLWYVEKKDSGWSEPQYLSGTISSHHPAQLSFTNDGTVYFISNVERKIFYAEVKNGIYEEAKLLQNGINNLPQTGHPCIAPDGSYIVVDHIARENDKMVSELFVSFRNKDNSWGMPKSLKIVLQMKDTDIFSAPRITYDGNYLFFEKYEPATDKSDLYWVSTKIFDDLCKEALKNDK